MRRPTTLLSLPLLVALLVPATVASGAESTGSDSTAALGSTATTASATTQPALAGDVRVSFPRTARRGRLTAVRLSLPASVAAIDGRLVVSRRAATLMGVAIYGRGTALRPVAVADGCAFGAYGLRTGRPRLVVDLVLLPRRGGALEVRVAVDSAASRTGTRVALAGGRAAGPAAEALRDGRLDRRDLDVARASWEEARLRGRVCGPRAAGDQNGDGCADAVDLQATAAALGARVAGAPRARIAADDDATRRHVVTSAADTPDAARGDGACADSQGRCTLRAAIAEAERLAGDDRITFDLPGAAPATIQVGSRLPYITSRSGTLVINGFTQPGARHNDAPTGSNMVPGVVIRGNGQSAREVGLYITSPDNIILGLAFTNLYRAIFLDGANAARNRIVGNWIGFDAAGVGQTLGNYGVLINVGAHDNLIGTPDLADRNVLGGLTLHRRPVRPGTDRDVIRNNQLCIRPSGATAFCYSGVDANFGPKDNQVGGDEPYERNVIGPTMLQGVELSHGWNPSLPYGTDTSTTWQVNGNRVIGNWVGFKADGSYASNFRSGYQLSNGDNGNAINVYDGTNDNLVARNFVSAVYDGVQIMSSNSRGNIVRGNVIGESPLGEDAPLTGWGIVVRWGTRYDQLINNTIRNAERGGIGLLNVTNYGSLVAVAYNIRISRNIVTGTGGPAIHLAPMPEDPAQTANDTTQPPAITEATTAQVRGTGIPGATVEVYRASRGAEASGLPVELVGDATVGDGGNWSLDVSGLSDGDRVTALQIRPDDNTSALSGNVAVGEAPPPPPPPDPGDLLASDAFERTDDDGWGHADTGGSWTLTADGFSVAAGEGRVTVAAGQVREARLAVDPADVEISGQVTVDRIPTGGNAFAYVLARATASSAIRGSIRVAGTGVVHVQLKRVVNRVESAIAPEVSSSLVASPGQPIRFRLRVVGDQLRMRVWQGATEPDMWLVTATDSTVSAAAGAGLMAYTGKSVTNGPVTYALDAFEVRQG